MKRFVWVCVALFSLSSCATYKWYHPSKGQDGFNQDSYNCTRESARDFPVAIQRETYGVGSQTPTQTTCTPLYGGQVNCTTTPGVYTPPPTIDMDANQGNRARAYNLCMNAQGWSLMKQADAEQQVQERKSGRPQMSPDRKRGLPQMPPEFEELLKNSN